MDDSHPTNKRLCDYDFSLNHLLPFARYGETTRPVMSFYWLVPGLTDDHIRQCHTIERSKTLLRLLENDEAIDIASLIGECWEPAYAMTYRSIPITPPDSTESMAAIRTSVRNLLDWALDGPKIPMTDTAMNDVMRYAIKNFWEASRPHIKRLTQERYKHFIHDADKDIKDAKIAQGTLRRNINVRGHECFAETFDNGDTWKVSSISAIFKAYEWTRLLFNASRLYDVALLQKGRQGLPRPELEYAINSISQRTRQTLDQLRWEDDLFGHFSWMATGSRKSRSQFFGLAMCIEDLRWFRSRWSETESDLESIDKTQQEIESSGKELHKPPPDDAVPPLAVDPVAWQVRVRGIVTPFDITEKQWRILKILVSAGRPISSTEFENHDPELMRSDSNVKAINRLPKPIRNWIDSKTGTGYWIRKSLP